MIENAEGLRTKMVKVETEMEKNNNVEF